MVKFVRLEPRETIELRKGLIRLANGLLDRIEGNTDAYKTMVLSGSNPLAAINATIAPEVHELYRKTIRFMYTISNASGSSLDKDIESLEERYKHLRRRDERVCMEVPA